jgi:hypothetical protein
MLIDPPLAGSLEQTGKTTTPRDRFSQGTLAPNAGSPLVEMDEENSIFLHGRSAVAAGNDVLTLLRMQECVEITKVNVDKFTIKLVAFQSGGRSCVIKVCVYTLVPGTEAPGAIVEWQRRSGDALAFSQIFKTVAMAINCDLQHTDCHRSCTRPLDVPSMEHCEKKFDAQYLAPILGMASCTSSVALQAEAASTLQVIVESDPLMVAKTCGAEATATFHWLLAADDLRVVYPTARALSSLTLCLQAI